MVAGDAGLIARLTLLRRHLGMMLPAPVQAAMAAALDDDAHVASQREVYARRRELLRGALEATGFTIDDAEAGLYLWVRREGTTDCWDLVSECARQGIVVGPGAFYGPAGAAHVRLSLTESDDRVAQAAERLRRG